MRRCLFFLFGMLCCVSLVMANDVKSLNIDVTLQGDGSVLVSERWELYFDQGTEWYVVCGNLGDRQLRLLGVTDETGREYALEDAWVVDRSRADKAGRCGVVDKGAGNYEICWGVGDDGEHVFVMRYLLTDVLQGYSDYDGFNHQFVAKNISPSPRSVSVVLHTADYVPLDTTNCRVWSFGYHGQIVFENENSVVASSNDFSSLSSVIVMMQFEKGLFQPNVVNESSFEDVKQRAFEDSDYASDELDELTTSDWVIAFVVTYFILGAFLPTVLFAPFIYPFRYLRRRLLKRKIRSCDWRRELPFDGELFATYYQARKRGLGEDMGIADALMLKLIMQKALVYSESQRGFVVNMVSLVSLETSSERALCNMLTLAAGRDGVLQPREFKRWAVKNDSTVSSWFKSLKRKSETAYKHYCEQKCQTQQLSESEVQKRAERETFGFVRFLTDFTLLNERKTVEVMLWKNYMVFATLLGVADEVLKELKQYQPVVALKLEALGVFAATSAIREVTRCIDQGVRSNEAITVRSSGGGGSSSFGGGGGYSGGGSGGGAR